MISRLTGIFRRHDDETDCTELRDLSSDYIDGELDAATSAKVNRHLEWCGPCNAFVNTLRATVAMLRAVPRRDAPDGFRERIRESVAQHRDSADD